MARCALSLLLLARSCQAWRRQGTLPVEHHFTMYLGKFCFDYATRDPETGKSVPAGTLEVTAEGLVEEGDRDNLTFEGSLCHGGPEGHSCYGGQLYFVAYSDESHRWQRAKGLWDELSCEERLRFSSLAIPLSPGMNLSGDHPMSPGGALQGLKPIITFSPHWRHKIALMEINRTIDIVQQVRPRLWYFAFLNCGARILQSVTYEVHAFNLHSGVEAELSMDMRGAVWLESGFAALFTLVSLVGTWAAVRGRFLQGPHGMRSRPLLLVLRASAGLSALGCAYRAVHHWIFLGDGYGSPFCGVLGSILACVAKLLLTVLQFFIAKGWSLFASPEEKTQRRMIGFAVVLVMLLSVGCEIRAHYYHDMGTNFYLYESWPGIIILALNLSLLGASWLMTWDTYLRETSPAVRAYYRLVSLSAGIYFASLPVICVIAGMLSPWVVRKIVERAELSSRLLATALLLACLWPSKVDALVSARLKNTQSSLIKADESMTELGESSGPRESEDAGLNTQLG